MSPDAWRRFKTLPTAARPAAHVNPLPKLQGAPRLKITTFVLAVLGVRTGPALRSRKSASLGRWVCVYTSISNNACSLHWHTAFVICVPNRGMQGGPHFPSECRTKGQQLFIKNSLGLH